MNNSIDRRKDGKVMIQVWWAMFYFLDQCVINFSDTFRQNPISELLQNRHSRSSVAPCFYCTYEEIRMDQSGYHKPSLRVLQFGKVSQLKGADILTINKLRHVLWMRKQIVSDGSIESYQHTWRDGFFFPALTLMKDSYILL